MVELDVFCLLYYSPSLQLNNVTVGASQQVRVLGVHLSSDLSLDKHVSSVSASCFHHLRQLRRRAYPALARRCFGSDTSACLRHVARRLLQRSPRRGSENNHTVVRADCVEIDMDKKRIRSKGTKAESWKRKEWNRNSNPKPTNWKLARKRTKRTLQFKELK